jgi:hypothetical protein
MTTVFKNHLQASIGTQLSITGVSGSGSVVTLTFADQGTAPFASGQSITVSGINISGYNGTYTVTGGSSATVTYANSTTTSATATGGVYGTISPCMLVTNASATTTVIGMSLTNNTSSIIQASVQLQDTVAGTQAYFVQNITIPPNTSAKVINGGERLVVGPSTNILLWSNYVSSIDAIISWVEIS